MLRIFSVFSVLVLVAVALTSVITPAQAAATKIMFLGDSITGNPGCWRALLWTRLQSSGFTNIDFVGTQPPQGCAVPYDGDSEGHGGILATNMADQNQLPPWLTANTPDIVVMLLGTNDVWSGKAPSVILTAFSKLVDQMRASNPNVKIIVGQILPMNPSGCSTCAQGAIDFDATIPGWASSKTTAQSPIIVVDQWTGFNTATDTVDGVHPNDAGNQKISDKWYPALSGLLSPSGVTPTVTKTATKTPEPSPVSAPDLWVSSVVTAPQGWTGGCANDLHMGVNVTIKNQGQVTLPAGQFVVDVSGTQQTVSGLAAGASVTLWFDRTGSLVVTVDITNMVSELSETNNTFNYTTVSATPPVLCTRTPTPTGSLTPVITNTLTRTPTLIGPTATGTGRSPTPAITMTRTFTPTGGFTATRTLTPTFTPTTPPVVTNTPTQPTGGACSPVTSTITAPFTWDGAGVYCWQIATIPGYVNNWNNNSVSINGVNFSNVYVASGSLPAKINGNYYISFNGSFAWSHLEVR
jgi:lysophospholipase L1-like esterase